MLRTHEAGTLRPEHVGTTVTLTGWVGRRRDHGGVAFIDLRDASGIVQVVARDEVLTGTAHDLRSEFCVKVTGAVTAREDKDVNPDLPTGGVDVVAAEIEVLSASEPPPFQIDERVTVGDLFPQQQVLGLGPVDLALAAASDHQHHSQQRRRRTTHTRSLRQQSGQLSRP